MNHWLLKKNFPGATTCILFGQPDAALETEFKEYRNVLWFPDARSVNPTSIGLNPASTQRVLVETTPVEKLEPLLTRFTAQNSKHLPSLYVAQSVLENSQTAYEVAIAQVHALLHETQQARVTRQKDGFTWQKHLLLNAEAYVQQRLPTAWEGALRGLPAFVCGAGPSLDVSAPRLAAVAGRGVIIAADTALRALARHEVPVDFAVSIDSAKHPAKCLCPDALPSRVVLSTASPPTWRDALPADRWLFLSGRQVTEDWFEQQGITRTVVPARENCGSTALELARFLGCAPIYLFGMDLAVDAPDQPDAWHNSATDSTLYTGFGFEQTPQLPTVPGNYAERVPTFLSIDWRALDHRLAEWPAGLVINVNDRGARFTNATLVHPDRFAVAAPAKSKAGALARLGDAAAPTAAAGQAALELLRTAGIDAALCLADLQAALTTGGPAAAALQFRNFLTANDRARIFGSFSFKLMPHLLPPVEGNAAFWQTLIDEFAELGELASAVNLKTSAPALATLASEVHSPVA